MADIPARTELAVTTGPIRGSRKIHVEGNPGVRVAMRNLRGPDVVRARAIDTVTGEVCHGAAVI